jgi:hypothetical protein
MQKLKNRISNKMKIFRIFNLTGHGDNRNQSTLEEKNSFTDSDTISNNIGQQFVESNTIIPLIGSENKNYQKYSSKVNNLINSNYFEGKTELIKSYKINNEQKLKIEKSENLYVKSMNNKNSSKCENIISFSLNNKNGKTNKNFDYSNKNDKNFYENQCNNFFSSPSKNNNNNQNIYDYNYLLEYFYYSQNLMNIAQQIQKNNDIYEQLKVASKHVIEMTTNDNKFNINNFNEINNTLLSKIKLF